MEKLIVTAALCGSSPMKEQNPAVPYSPAEIAAEAVRCAEAGAAIVHIHVRDPETGAPLHEKQLFAEVVQRIRAESDILINLTTSGLNLKGPDAGELRLAPIDLKPDICSLDVGSLNFGSGVFQNPADWVEKGAMRMLEAGVKPEIEVFEMGHIRQAKDLIEQELIAPPPWFQLCTGIPWGIEGSIDSLVEMTRRLPPGAPWSVLSVGKLQLPITTHAMLMGGHVRVGFEDNLYLSRGVKADSNARFVERVIQLADILQRPVATVAEARQTLGLPAAP